MTTKNKWSGRLGWFGIITCGICCTLPIVGILTGLSSLTALGIYLEKIGLIALGLAGVLFAIPFLRMKKSNACADSCSTDCHCKTSSLVQTKHDS